MDVVKINKDGRKGIVIIPEKQMKNLTYSLNIVLTEDNHLVALQSDEFEKIGEIDD